jgi:hypothetical protein
MEPYFFARKSSFSSSGNPNPSLGVTFFWSLICHRFGYADSSIGTDRSMRLPYG